MRVVRVDGDWGDLLDHDVAEAPCGAEPGARVGPAQSVSHKRGHGGREPRQAGSVGLRAAFSPSQQHAQPHALSKSRFLRLSTSNSRDPSRMGESMFVYGSSACSHLHTEVESKRYDAIAITLVRMLRLCAAWN